jgi:mannose/fructose/N-acetylgalactosamine-specific phosphotransferase system component IID
MQQQSDTLPPNTPNGAGSLAQPHDDIHIVAPTWQPLVTAIGIALTLAGIAVTPIMWIAGLVIMITGIVNWLTELRRDYKAPSADLF